jgi:hypothetical protein
MGWSGNNIRAHGLSPFVSVLEVILQQLVSLSKLFLVPTSDRQRSGAANEMVSTMFLL